MNEMPLTREAKRQHEARIVGARSRRQARDAASRRSAEARLREDLIEAQRIGIPAAELRDLLTREMTG